MWDDITLKNDKVMICGSLINLDMKERLIAKGFEEGNKRTAGTFTLEKAFVGYPICFVQILNFSPFQLIEF